MQVKFFKTLYLFRPRDAHLRSYVIWDFIHFLPVSEFDRHEILLYEEVAKVPPFKRKTLILIGAQGVGRRRLKNKLLLRDPLLFGTTIPCMKSPVSMFGYIHKTQQSTCYCDN